MPSPEKSPAMATVEKKVQLGKTDPFGTGKILVTDCLDKLYQQSDPSCCCTTSGRSTSVRCRNLGCTPPRVQRVSLPEAGSVARHGSMEHAGEGQDALFAEGQLQWGKSGRGIEHGMKFDPTYDGPVQGFQLWINLKSANKLDPPEFQNARRRHAPGRRALVFGRILPGSPTARRRPSRRRASAVNMPTMARRQSRGDAPRQTA